MGATIFAGGDPSKVDVSGYAKGDILAADATGTLTVLAIGTQSEVLTVDTADPQDLDYQAGGGGGGGTPSNTVVTETSFGQAATAGLLSDYSRGDHTHGTPTAPTVPTPATTVTSETSFGVAPAVGTGVLYARNDHTHGSPTAPTAASVGADPAGSAAAAQTASNKRIVLRQAYVTSGDVTPLPNTGGTWVKFTGVAELLIPAAVGDYVDIAVNGLRAAASTFMDVGVVTGGGAAIQRYMSTGTSSPAAANEGNPGWYIDASFISYRGPQGFVVAAGDLDAGNVRWAILLRSTSGVGTFYASANYPFYWRAMNFGPVN